MAGSETPGDCPKGGEHDWHDRILTEDNKVVQVGVNCRKCNDFYVTKSEGEPSPNLRPGPSDCPDGSPHDYRDEIEKEDDRVIKVTVVCTRCGDRYSTGKE